MTHRALALVAALCCLLAAPLTLAGTHSPVRVAAAVGLLALAPGLATLPWNTERPVPLELALVIATSLALSALGAQLMLLLDVWSPTTATCVLAGACLLAITARLVREGSAAG